MPAHLKHQSLAIRPLSLGNWMFDIVANLASSKPAAAAPLPVAPPVLPLSRSKHRLTIAIPSPLNPWFDLPAPLPAAHTVPVQCHMSLQFTPTSPVFSFNASTVAPDEDNAWKGKEAVTQSGANAHAERSMKYIRPGDSSCDYERRTTCC